MSVPVSGEHHERAVEVFTNHLQTEWAGPYMARIRDFTEEQIEAGELRAADDQAHEQAKSEARRAIDAYFASLAEQGIRLVDLLKCSACGGFGQESLDPARLAPCPHCGGTGYAHLVDLSAVTAFVCDYMNQNGRCPHPAEFERRFGGH